MQRFSHSAGFALLALTLQLAWAGTASALTDEEESLALAYGDRFSVSIATGGAQPAARAPAVTSVITAQDIQVMGATDLDQALKNVAGLHVSMNNTALNPIYSFRGIHTQYNPQVLMLVNGLPITNVFWGDRGQLWGGMPLENVARIEVIRGPGSALYGADAFSGTINIITKTAANIGGTQVGARAGSFNSKDAWVQHGGKLGTVDAAFYLRAGNTDGHRGILQQDAAFFSPASNAPGPLNTERKMIDASTDLSFDAWRLRAGYQDRELGIGAGVAGALDPVARAQSTRSNLDLSYEQKDWLANWDISAVVGYYDNKEKGNPYYTLFPAGALPGFPNGMIANPAHSERHTHGSVSAYYTGIDKHHLRLGVGTRVDDMYEVSELKNFDANLAPLPALVQAAGNPALVYLTPHKRNVNYVFVQDEWYLARDWTLTAGVRHDRYSDFGETSNPRLALVWEANYNLTIKALHGTAFRAPSFAEQYSINNPVVIGNPNIKPETITTDELAFNWQPTGSLETKLNFFQYRMRNIIRPAPVVYQNSGDQTGRGMEIEGIWTAASNLQLSGNYSLQHSKDGTTGLDAGMAPHQRIFAKADWRVVPMWQLGTTVNYVAGRMRQPGDTRLTIPDYTTVDMMLRHDKFANGIEVRAMVNNVFDHKGWEPTFLSSGIPSDLPIASRAFYLQLVLEM